MPTRSTVRYEGEREQYSLPPVYIWDTPEARLNLWSFRDSAIIVGIIFIGILFLWLFRAIPSWPLTLLHYCAAYYLFAMPLYCVINFTCSYHHNKEVHLFLGLTTNIISFIGCSFLVYIIWYQLVTCWTGNSPFPACRETQLMDAIMGLITIVLFLITMYSLGNYIALSSKLKITSSPNTIFTSNR
jgi:hypothetical protein